MTFSNEDMVVLTAYSEGTIGWRAACRDLRLLNLDELHSLLEEHQLPAPVADDTPLDKETQARFNAILQGESGDDA